MLRPIGKKFRLVAAMAILAAAAGTYFSSSNTKVLASWEDTGCGVTEPRIAIIKDVDTWSRNWLLMQGRDRFNPRLAQLPSPGISPALSPPAPPAPPPFNPQTTVAIAIFMGAQPSAGPRITLERISARFGGLTVTARGYYPSGPPPLMITSPCLLLQIERPEIPIVVRARFRNTYLEVTD